MEGAEEVGRYRTETEAVRSFCRRCGSPLTYESPRWPGEVHVAVAQFEETLGRPPCAHVYADRSPDWCPVTDALPRYGGPSGCELLPEA